MTVASRFDYQEITAFWEVRRLFLFYLSRRMKSARAIRTDRNISNSTNVMYMLSPPSSKLKGEKEIRSLQRKGSNRHHAYGALRVPRYRYDYTAFCEESQAVPSRTVYSRKDGVTEAFSLRRRCLACKTDEV